MSATSEKYLRFLGPKRTAQDRRRLWAREDREYKGWDGLSKGERRSRDRFARLTANGADPAEAVRDALGLKHGHIPQFETESDFTEFWTPDQLSEIANRWLRSPYFRRFSKSEIHAAQHSLAAAANVFAATLVDVATDEKAPKAARVKAAATGLALVGLVAGSKIEEDASDKKKSLQQKTRLTLLKKAPATGTDGEA